MARIGSSQLKRRRLGHCENLLYRVEKMGLSLPKNESYAAVRGAWSPRLVLNGDLGAEVRTILGLSPREFAIAVAIAEGCSRTELAIEFACSSHTIDSHIRRIFSKLGVNSAAAIGGRLVSGYHAALIQGR